MIVVVMGVSGSGKSTIGKLLADSLDWEFADADSFHSPENVEKMRHGIALNDLDRMPWLLALQQAIQKWLEENKNAVLACSALKASYRQSLVLDEEQVIMIYLRGSFELIQERLHMRLGHFMTAQLLQTQFDTLEEPDGAIILDVSESPAVIVEKIRASLGI